MKETDQEKKGPLKELIYSAYSHLRAEKNN